MEDIKGLEHYYSTCSKDELELRINNFDENRYIGYIKSFTTWFSAVMFSFITFMGVMYSVTMGFYQKYAYVKGHSSKWFTGYKKELNFYLLNVIGGLTFTLIIIAIALGIIIAFNNEDEKERELLYRYYHKKDSEIFPIKNK
ncbi:hypothetical protein ACFQAV_05385 [Companilactobacillus huachuanensis]|uniref:Uncharacterized protein n=1 Tax=Companilactobacillus huachuanensis TaxID=2559914 RepID=A0ABW1RJI9_9LACO|nr:hypothetical protein [Companilactobacillus huachuanensis]